MSRFLNQREQKIFIICLVAVFAAFFYNNLILPLQREANLLQGEIEIEKTQLDGNFKVIEKAERFEAQYENYLKRYGKTGTEEEVASSILSEIEKVTGKLKLHVAELKPQRIEHDEFSDRFSIQLTMSSEFVDIVRFLHTLQQSPYFFDVEEVEFKRSAKRGQGAITTRLVLGKSFILTDSNKQIDDRREENIPL